MNAKKIHILICLIAKITIYYAKHHNIKPSIKQFLTNLKLEADTEFRSARLSNNLNIYYDKWKQLKFLPEHDIDNILRQDCHRMDDHESQEQPDRRGEG